MCSRKSIGGLRRPELITRAGDGSVPEEPAPRPWWALRHGNEGPFVDQRWTVRSSNQATPLRQGRLSSRRPSVRPRPHGTSADHAGDRHHDGVGRGHDQRPDQGHDMSGGTFTGMLGSAPGEIRTRNPRRNRHAKPVRLPISPRAHGGEPGGDVRLAPEPPRAIYLLMTSAPPCPNRWTPRGGGRRTAGSCR